MPDQQTHSVSQSWMSTPSYAGVTRSQGGIALMLIFTVWLTVFWFAAVPRKYEYIVKDIPDAQFGEQMSQFGKDGWELVFAHRASEGPIVGVDTKFDYEVILKRPTGLF